MGRYCRWCCVWRGFFARGVPGRRRAHDAAMKLYLVQHAEAVAKDMDADRPLSDTGRADVERLAALLGRHEVAPVRIVHSGKTRARQTAEILAAKLAGTQVIEAAAGLAPGDPVEPWIEEAGGRDEDIMLVGHLPFMGRLVSGLVSRQPSATVVDYRPGSIVCLERDGAGGWVITWMLRPELVAGES